jgi:hypothetical protein
VDDDFAELDLELPGDSLSRAPALRACCYLVTGAKRRQERIEPAHARKPHEVVARAELGPVLDRGRAIE